MAKENKGYSSLINLGNTCFMNSTLQALFHSPDLKELIEEDNIKEFMKKGIDTELFEEFCELYHTMWNNNAKISPNKFVHNMFRIAKSKDKELFTGWSQNDMPEFLLFLLDAMHTSISRPITVNISGQVKNSTDGIAVKCYELLKQSYTKEYSEIMELFYGIYLSEIISMDDSIKHSSKPEQYMTLDLPLPPNTKGKSCSLYECFDNFTAFESLTGENAWYNEKTKMKEDVKKRFVFWSFPKTLVIVLKRFSEDGRKKNKLNVECPLTELDLSKYIHGYSASTYIYELYGVCNHIGEVGGGHYTVFIKNQMQEWLHYNDDKVSRIDEDNVISPLSYCLFYCKKNKSL